MTMQLLFLKSREYLALKKMKLPCPRRKGMYVE
jgi:hypothetical protein